MNNILLLAIPVSIIVLNGPLLRLIRKNNKRDTEIIRSDLCHRSKIDHCPMKSYKQCTNNYLPVHKCKCEERAYELCPVHQRFNEKLYQSMHEPYKKSSKPIYFNNRTRVNYYQSAKTEFDYLK